MAKQRFNYEEVFMGVRGGKPDTYKLSFKQEYRLRSLTQSVTLKKGTLLDIGCGGGRISETLPYYFPKISIYGCDVSVTAIKYARKIGSGKVKYSEIKDKQLPYKSNFFDACICLDVLEHIPDVDFFLEEVKRILKKNGAFFLIVPCEGEKFTYTWVFQKIKHGSDLTYRYFGHIHPEFTHTKVIEILKKHKFIIEKTSYSEHVFYQLLHLLIFFLPKILLEFFFGKQKASEYSDSSLVSAPKSKSNPLIVVRSLWFLLFNFLMMYPMNFETIIFKNIPLTAWKLHVMAKKEVASG